jgi:ribonuclease E
VVERVGATADVYAWSWPARLSGDDPYEWRGPIARPEASSEPEPAQAAEATPLPAPAPAETGQVTTAAQAAVDSAAGTGFGQPLEDAWVELPEVAEKPARSRRARGRGRGAAAEAEAVDETPATAAIEDPVETSVPAAAEAPTATTEPEAANIVEEVGIVAAPVTDAPDAPDVVTFDLVTEEPVAEEPVAPEPVAVEPTPPAAPDPAELSAPPAAPRRGWWRRGG